MIFFVVVVVSCVLLSCRLFQFDELFLGNGKWLERFELKLRTNLRILMGICESFMRVIFGNIVEFLIDRLIFGDY